jgi:hypothetical protein
MIKKIDVFSIKNIHKSDDLQAFRNWYRNAKRKEAVVYHIGEECGGPYKHQAMSMQDDGLVSLVQSRYGPKHFAYVAEKIK